MKQRERFTSIHARPCAGNGCWIAGHQGVLDGSTAARGAALPNAPHPLRSVEVAVKKWSNSIELPPEWKFGAVDPWAGMISGFQNVTSYPP